MVRRMAGALAAASALSAEAFLIPPGVHSMDNKANLAVVTGKWQAVTLPCPECVISAPKTKVKDAGADELDSPIYIMGGANNLLVNVSTLFDGRAIGLPDDYPLYPPLASYNKAQIEMVSASGDRAKSARVSADSMFVSEETINDKGEAGIRIKYNIVSVDGHPVTVDTVEVTCIKGSDDKLTLVGVEVVPRPHQPAFDALTPPPPMLGKPNKPACDMPAIICQMRDFVEAKMSAIAHNMPHKLGPRPGCHGGKGKGMHKGPHGHKGGAWKAADGSVHIPSHHRFRPGMGNDVLDENHGPRRFGSHGHHHHHHHSPLHGLARGFLMVLIPIFLGISMGMAVSLLGMIVGRMITFLWIHFVRGYQRGYASVRLSEEEAENAEAPGKASFDEPLPTYEAAPAYEENEKQAL